MLETRRGF